MQSSHRVFKVTELYFFTCWNITSNSNKSPNLFIYLSCFYIDSFISVFTCFLITSIEFSSALFLFHCIQLRIPFSSFFYSASVFTYFVWEMVQGSFIFGGFPLMAIFSQQETSQKSSVYSHRVMSGRDEATYTSTLSHARHPQAGLYWDLLCLYISMHLCACFNRSSFLCVFSLFSA